MIANVKTPATYCVRTNFRITNRNSRMAALNRGRYQSFRLVSTRIFSFVSTEVFAARIFLSQYSIETELSSLHVSDRIDFTRITPQGQGQDC